MNILFAEMKNVELKCHIAKSELHNFVLTVDDCIGGSQEWPLEYNRHIIGSHSYWLRIKNNKVHWVVEFVHLHQDIFYSALRNFY